MSWIHTWVNMPTTTLSSYLNYFRQDVELHVNIEHCSQQAELCINITNCSHQACLQMNNDFTVGNRLKQYIFTYIYQKPLWLIIFDCSQKAWYITYILVYSSMQFKHIYTGLGVYKSDLRPVASGSSTGPCPKGLTLLTQARPLTLPSTLFLMRHYQVCAHMVHRIHQLDQQTCLIWIVAKARWWYNRNSSMPTPVRLGKDSNAIACGLCAIEGDIALLEVIWESAYKLQICPLLGCGGSCGCRCLFRQEPIVLIHMPP